MGVTTETVPGRPQGLRTSMLRRPLSLRDNDVRIQLDPDGSVRSFDSLSEGRSLFGLERIWLYKVQAGVIVQAQKPDWSLKPTPRSALLTGRVFDNTEVIQFLEFFQGSSSGYTRRMRFRNLGQSPIKLRMIVMSDPSAAQFGDVPNGWGSLGLNAFNRGSHIAMDEVSDPPSARVVGALPPPARFYMTNNRFKAQEITTSGEFPDATAGMSGQLLILSLHELELARGETKEVSFASIYNPKRLEDALSDFGALGGAQKASRASRARFACSNSSLTEAASWAVATLDGSPYVKDPLDRLETLRALNLVAPEKARLIVDRSKESLRKEGSTPHSFDPSRPGILETSLLLQGLAWYVLLAQDKKLTRSQYPLVRRLASFLCSLSKDFAVRMDPAVPQGWRRLLGRGFPTGEIPEVSLAVAAALASSSQVARLVSKSGDAGKFRESSEMVAEGVRKRLLDDRGFLSLCLESSGRLRSDETIDMAVAAYRHPFLQSAEQAAAHRLLEKDFETPYGPRCVPRSNQVYFNGSYGTGQLGGFWTRAALAHALLCYRVGLAGIGSLSLKKIAKLVTEDFQALKGVPGEFPYWVDIEGREVRGDDSDPVAAARLLEGIVLGELGVSDPADRLLLSPPGSSSLSWVLATELWLGERVSVFVGRAEGKRHVFLAANRVEAREANRFARAEVLDPPAKGVVGVSFFGPGQVICLGNTTSYQIAVGVNFPPRGAELTKQLSAPVEALDQVNGSWTKVSTIRVGPSMAFETSLAPNDWKAFRISV